MQVNRDPNALVDDTPDPGAVLAAPKIKPVNLAPVPLGGGAADAAGPPDPITRPALPSVPPMSSVPPVAPAAPAAPMAGGSVPPVPPVAGAVPPLAPKPLDTLSGAWTPPTAAPGSAPLIASAAGGTMTPQGDASNSLRGAISDLGGTFGGANADKQDPAAWSKVANGDPATIAATIGGADTALSTASAKEVAKMLNGSDTQQQGLAMLAKLNPAQRAAVQQAFLDPAGTVASDQAGYDPNRASQQGMYESAWQRLQGQIPSAATPLPAGRLAGNYTAKDPAAQVAGLAAQGLAPSRSGVPMNTGGVDERTRAEQERITGEVNAPPLTAPGALQRLESAVPSSGARPVNLAPTAVGGDVPRGTPAAPTGVSTAPSTTPYTAEDNFLNKIIARSPSADRFKIAQSQYDTAVKASDPQYQADLRDANRMAAAGGAIGSGMLNTSLGDIVSNRQNRLDTQRTGFLDEALKGTIADTFGDTGIAQQQQGFQAGRSDTAFNQGVTEAELKDTLTNSSFGRSLQQLIVGQGGSPSDALMTLSSILGGQAGSAGQSLTDLIRGNATKKAAGGSGGGAGDIADWLQRILAGGGGAKPAGNIPSALPTGRSFDGGTGPINPLAVH